MLRAILIAFVLFVLTPDAFGQDFEVVSISKNLTYAVLKDVATGRKSTVTKGQEIGGWRLVEITPSKIVLGKFDSNDTVFLRHLPITHKVKLQVQRP